MMLIQLGRERSIDSLILNDINELRVFKVNLLSRISGVALKLDGGLGGKRFVPITYVMLTFVKY